jgi:tetratricopeptide (TPR) repeat protein
MKLFARVRVVLLVPLLMGAASALQQKPAEHAEHADGAALAAKVQQALRDLQQGKDVDKDVALLRDALQQAPDAGQFAQQVGALLFSEGRFQQSLAFLEVARAKRPQDGNVALLLGKSHAALFHFADAQRELTAAEKLLPPGPRPIVSEYLSKVLVPLQRVDEAVERAKRAIDEARQWNAAVPAGKQPLDLVEFELNLANVYESAVRPDDAIAVLDALEKSSSEKLTAHQRAKSAEVRAKILDGKGDADGAAASFEVARAAAPDDVETVYEYATFRVRRNQHAEARPLLEHVVKLDPEHLGAHYNLARVLLRLGEKPLADATLARYQQLHEAKVLADQKLTELAQELGKR